MMGVYGSLARVEPEQLGETTTTTTNTDGTVSTIVSLGRLAGAVTGAYHGYKRNNGSVGWAIGWFLLGGAFWPVTIPVSLAQGFGKPEQKT